MTDPDIVNVILKPAVNTSRLCRALASVAPRLFLILTLGLCIVSMPKPAYAQAEWEIAKKRLSDAKNWEEMCAIEDCNQFPKGYATWLVGSQYYYFLLSRTLTERPPGLYGVRVGRFYELDEEGYVTRSFDYGGGYRFIECCHYMLTYFRQLYGVSENAENDPRRVSTIKFETHPNRFRYRSSIWSRMRKENYRHLPFPTFAEAFPEPLRSYNDDFWIVRIRQRQRSGNIPFNIISKEPLLTNRHVYGYCYTYCSFYKVSFQKDVDNTLPDFEIDTEYIARNLFLCEPDELESGCDPLSPDFPDVPAMLAGIEETLEFAKRVPPSISPDRN